VRHNTSVTFADIKEAAVYAGRSVKTLLRWERAGLPVYRPAGGRPLVDLDELDAFIRSGAREAQAPPEARPDAAAAVARLRLAGR
jgi:hypothetical protein